jgi:uncharacterized SAM-binding protein YcdF (DUF218 family)
MSGTPDPAPRPGRWVAPAPDPRAPGDPGPIATTPPAAGEGTSAAPPRAPGEGAASPAGPAAIPAATGAPHATLAPAPQTPAAAPSRAAVLPGPPTPGPSPAPPARPRRRRVRLAALLVLPLALLLGFALHLRAALAPALPAPGETDAILVLTGGSERVATGLRLLAEGQARRLLISGAHPEADLPEIAAAAGIDAAPVAGRVAVGHAAATTRGNAAEAAAWVRAEGIGSLRVVTAGYHMPRAMLELRRAMPGLRLVAHPVPSAALRTPGALWRPRIWALLAGEYARYLGAAAGLSGAFVPRRESPAT